MLEVAERAGDVAGLAVRWLEAPASGAAPVLYVHGVPTGSADWLPYLERIGGVAPDLPGFGRSAKPADFDYSITGFDRWLEAFTELLALTRFSLVVHDWGVVGLAFAQRFPERIERLVVHTCAPLLTGYRWHWIARLWRTRGVGELFMATSTRWGLKQISRQANVTKGPLPDSFLDRFWPDFDRDTRRAILRLYRSSPPEVLARAGEGLGELDCPTLILWSTQDPYIGAEWGQRYAEAFGGQVRLEMIEDAGHWLWLDRPDVVDIAADFLEPQIERPEVRASASLLRMSSGEEGSPAPGSPLPSRMEGGSRGSAAALHGCRSEEAVDGASAAPGPRPTRERVGRRSRRSFSGRER